MANELVLIRETQPAIDMTCANATGIAKGACLKLSDPNTVATVTADNDIVGGVAGEEKIASDGRTKIKVYRGGIFKAFASGTVTVGDGLAIEGDTINTFRSVAGLSAANLSGTKIWGVSLETAAVGESFLMELRPSIWAGSAV